MPVPEELTGEPEFAEPTEGDIMAIMVMAYINHDEMTDEDVANAMDNGYI